MNRTLPILMLLVSQLAIGQQQLVFKNLEDALQHPDSVYNLDLSGQNLKEFPSEIFGFRNLQSLNLAENEIESVPDSIHLLTKLEELDLGWFWGGNEISELPATIGKLKTLKELSLSYNKIRLLPKEIGLLKNLRVLFVDFNRLVAIPDEIGNLTNLEVLGLADNKLSSLPSTTKNLTNLKMANLSQNNFSKEERVRVIKLLPGHCGVQF